MDMEIIVGIVEGCERYLDPDMLEEISRLTGAAYEKCLEADSDFHNGQGNCWIVAAAAGQVFDKSGKVLFPFGGHYWTVINKSIVVDAPNPSTITIWPLHELTELYQRRMVPLKISKKGNANMRKVKRDVLPLSIATRDWILRNREGDAINRT